jgi:DNA polymerase elongation subunit (family B)
MVKKEIIFLPVDYDYFDFNGRNYVKIIGRDDKNKRVCLIDEFQAYFYAIFKQDTTEKKIKEIQEKVEKLKVKTESRETKVEKIELESKNFLSKPVKALKIFVTNYKDSHAIADKIGFEEIEFRREYDIPLITKHIENSNLIPLTWRKISGELVEDSEFSGINNIDVDYCIKVEKIEKTETKESEKEKTTFSPNILAFDIETDEYEIGKGEILMISLYGNYEKGIVKKVLTWKNQNNKDKPDYVQILKSEEDMLEAFVKEIKEISPDILVGYFSDGFDMPYLKARAEKLGVKLALGLDNSKPNFTRGRVTSSSIFGIVHIDLFRFIETVLSQYLQSETLGLNEVSKELLGEGKKDFDKSKRTGKIKEHEWKDFFEYNMHDSYLTYKLTEKLWPDMLEFSRIIEEPLWDITRSGMSQLVEDYILHNLNRFDEIAEKRPVHEDIETRRERQKYEGAFVLQPTPGLYEDVAMFDFTSSYASIIVSFNLSKSTLLEKKDKDSYEVELENKKTYFSKKKGFMPELLEEIINLRKKYKKELKESPNPLKKARSNAFKLLANAYYGYNGFFGARYYCVEAAAAAAALARKYMKEVIEKTNKEDYKVLYADTDSIAFLMNKKSKKEIFEFLTKLNKELPGIMELELEDFYKRGLWVTKRTGDFGAKKKYALINEKGKLKIRGFETVRRDWCDLARELQSKVLELILKEGNHNSALELTKRIIKELKERKIERDKILITTQLKKPISEYKSITPHVIAAQKMKEAGMPIDIGSSIEYFIAEVRSEKEKKLVREKVKLPDEKGEYNIDYYLNHQLIPAVENIFDVFNINIKEILEGSKQTKLF